MVKSSYVPERGDIVWIDLDPVKGHEQSGRRPAFVVSPQIYNSRSGLALLCPITSRVKGYPFEVGIMLEKIRGAILVDQLKSMDWKVRRARLLARAGSKVINEVQEKARTLID